MYYANEVDTATPAVMERVNELTECLKDCDHAPESVRLIGNPPHGEADGVEAVYGVDDRSEAVTEAKAILNDLPDEERDPDFFRLHGAHPEDREAEVGPMDLGIIWKGINDELAPMDTGIIWKSIEEPHGPNSAEIDVPEDRVDGSPRWVTWHEAVGPSDFPELWRRTEEVTGMGLPTLVELNLDAMEEHTLTRLYDAVAEEIIDRDPAGIECHREVAGVSARGYLLQLNKRVEADNDE